MLGVRCHGEIGVRRLGLEAPGRERPACSRCSGIGGLDYGSFRRKRGNEEGGDIPSDQFSREAMIWRTWNFLGSDRSRARKWRKWLVIRALSIR